MSKKTDITELAELPLEEIEERIQLAAGRVEQRIQRVQTEERDLTEREADLCSDDKIELSALKDALQLRCRNAEYTERMTSALGEAIETRASGREWQPSLLVSRQHLAEHAAALREGRPYGAVEVVETRARVTAASDLGAAFVDEGTAHGEYDAIAPVSLTALRYGRWSDVSALANEVDDLRGVNQMHAWGIARDLDLLAVAAVETAAGTAAVLTDLEEQVREAILAVAAGHLQRRVAAGSGGHTSRSRHAGRHHAGQRR